GLLDHPNVTARAYQALGNAYDFNNQPAKAIETYEKGLKRFPDAGELYLERGNMDLFKKDYENALSYYEQGIKLDPKFPSNYYWASKLYYSSSEEVWGMIYGEIFMNLERNSKRTAEISKLLFDTYKSGIQFTSDTSMTVSFSQSIILDSEALKESGKFKLPFGTGCYEMNLMLALVGESKVDLASLDRIRTGFLERYFGGDNAKDYPNALFNFQKTVKNAGHLEAYNYWVLMKGDEEGFRNWRSKNEGKWTSFVDWFTKNGLELDYFNRFYRLQYKS
ncbi:MAG: tetratricopeptide repeat protein, partial [Chitinophagaceae bacterium]